MWIKSQLKQKSITKLFFKQLILSMTLLCYALVVQSADTIKLGMSAVMTGPAAALGNDMRSGIESYFEFVNNNGGIQNRQLELTVYDDGYEPERAAFNMRKLIDEDKVLAVIGNVGTPTAIVTAPIAQEKKTLLFGAFSGGGVLRPQTVSPYIINYRPSYAEETQEMIKGLMQVGVKPEEIAFFTQRDGYGNAAYRGAISALETYGFRDSATLAHGRYTRNTLNVEDAVAVLLDSPITPKVVIMAGGYAPSAKFIKLLQKELPDIWFTNVSFVGSHSLQKELAENTNNVIVMQVVPDIESSLPIIIEYLSALAKYNAKLEPNTVSLEGFIIAKIFCQGLDRIKGNVTRKSIIDAIETLGAIDIGLGVDIYYDKLDHQAIHTLWMTSMVDGMSEPFTWDMMTLDKGVDE